MRTPRLSRLAAAALFVTHARAAPRPRPPSAGQRPGRCRQPARLQPQGAGQPQGRGRHHLLGVGLAQANLHDAAGDHQRLQLVAVQGARHPGHPGGLRRHLAEVPGRPLQRAAARRRAAGGPAHPGGHRHRLVPAGAVLHERRQVLDERLPAPAPGLLEGERRAVGPPLRRLGADPVLQPERLHEGRASTRPTRRPRCPQMVADAKALKASGSGMGLVLDPWHLETWLATANQLFVNNKQRAQQPGHQGRVRHQDRGVHLQPARARWCARATPRPTRRPVPTSTTTCSASAAASTA